jgi:chemotaxis protein methyltransferase CheR
MTPEDFNYVCRLVREHSAIVLEPGKEYLVEGRLLPIAQKMNLGSVGDFITHLRSSPSNGLHKQVIEAMVTTETSFFRDVHPFESLRTIVLPDLIKRRQDVRRIDVWCAASSTGQEPYSLAMLVREHFPQLVSWQFNILATDLSAEVLARARAGRYNQIEANRGLPISLLIKYFRQDGTTWELSEDIRRMVEFRELNLTKPLTIVPRVDLVFLRNVMIYFDVETKKAILGRVKNLLRPDGYLLLGGAETTMNLCDAFKRNENIKGGFYQLAE